MLILTNTPLYLNAFKFNATQIIMISRYNEELGLHVLYIFTFSPQYYCLSDVMKNSLACYIKIRGKFSWILLCYFAMEF